MDLLGQLTWFDIVIILVFVAGVFVGFTQGMIRYALNCVAVLVAFVLAAQLKGPIVELLGFWQAFSAEGRELLIFVILYVGFVIAAWFAIRALYRRTRLPIPRVLDEVGGAVLGLLWVGLVIGFLMVVYDSYFIPGGEARGFVEGFYTTMNESVLVQFLRETVVPIAGYLVRPFVPSDIADLLTA